MSYSIPAIPQPLGSDAITTTAAQAVGTTDSEIFNFGCNHIIGFVDLTFFVGAASSLSAFSIWRTSVVGGTPVEWLSGSAFATATTLNPLTVVNGGTWIIPVAAGAVFLMTLNLEGCAELRIHATGTLATTLALETSFYISTRVNM